MGLFSWHTLMGKTKGKRSHKYSICKCLSSPLAGLSEREGLLTILSDPRLDDPEAAPVKELLLRAAGIQEGGRSMKGGAVLTLRMLANVLTVAIILGAGVGLYQAGAAAAAADWSIKHLIRVGILNPLCRSGLGGWVDASYRLASGSGSCLSIVARNTAVFRYIMGLLSPVVLGGGFVVIRDAILAILVRLVPAGVDPDAHDEAIVAAVDAELIAAAGVGDPVMLALPMPRRFLVRSRSASPMLVVPRRRDPRSGAQKAPRRRLTRRKSIGGKKKKPTRKRPRHKRRHRK